MTVTPDLDLCDRLPKVELHCHVEGTVRPATVVELARKAGQPIPVNDPTELYRYDSLDSFLSIFTDDPAMMDWDLGREYEALAVAQGFRYGDARQGRGRWDRVDVAR